MSSLQRLYVQDDLAINNTITMTKGQAHYLRNVLRMQVRDKILLFNGKDGEWLCNIDNISKRFVQVVAMKQTRKQTPSSDIWLLAAPIKRARLDYLVQKATEMGVVRIILTKTAYTNSKVLKLERLYDNAIEAAEQCNILSVPDITAPIALEEAVALCENRDLIFCDEAQAEAGAEMLDWQKISPKCAVLIGPEGGFAENERHNLYQQKQIHILRLGHRILRSDTAMVAALALVQNYIGDWHK